MKRRRFIRGVLAGAALGGQSWSLFGAASSSRILTKPIPSTGEVLPVIGMGTWITFNVGSLPSLLRERTEILRVFFNEGGGLIDSSPMYGSAEKVVGHCLEELGYPEGLFSATKIWTSSTGEGKQQVERSQALWGVQTLDLEQVHNLIHWREHLKHLRALKEAGTIRYLGITTSHGRRHGELEQIMKSEPLDFVQLTYNIANRKAEDRLLGLALDRGQAVIANRPYGGGSIIDRLQRNHPLPSWAGEVGARHWPEFLLKFIVSHPAVTCAIPATSQVQHMRENMQACRGLLPDASQRRRMADTFDSL